MTKTLTRTITVAGVLALLATGAFAQGWGRGQGWRAGGICPGGYAGGWQEKLQSLDNPDLVARITALHNEIREAQWNLRAAAAQGEDTTALQARVDALRADLKAANEEAGFCTGEGPRAYGLNGNQRYGMGYGQRYGMGYGQRNGMGYGQRNGMGYGRGYGMGNGRGNGQGYGRGNGYGYAGNCPYGNTPGTGMGYGRGYGNGWGRASQW